MTTILWMYYHHANEITFYVSLKILLNAELSILFTEQSAHDFGLHVPVDRQTAKVPQKIADFYDIDKANQDSRRTHRHEVGHVLGHFEGFLQLLHFADKHRFGLES